MIPSASNPELEALIRERPDDVERYLVYGDWLQSRGDGRGELIVAQVARENLAASGTLTRKQQQQLDDLTGLESRTLKPLQDELRREFASLLTPDGPRPWRYGFLQEVTLRAGSFTPSAAREIERLVKHPSARFLRKVSLSPTVAEGTPTWVLDLVAQLGEPACLESLAVPTGAATAAEANFSAIGAAFPRLTSLSTTSLKTIFDRATFPALRSLELAGLSVEWSRSSRAPWPAVRSLTLNPAAWGRRRIPDWAPELLSGAHWLPQLRELTSRHSYGDEICEVLVDSPLLDQLERLDLTDAATNRNGRLLLKHAPRLKNLQRLYLGNGPTNWQRLDNDVRATLKATFGERVRFNLPTSYFEAAAEK